MIVNFCYIDREGNNIFVAEDELRKTDRLLNNINACVSENNGEYYPMVMTRSHQKNIYPKNEAKQFAIVLAKKNSKFKA
ncbi:MAG TPA: hypothetical protein P5060_04240 [Candidatus Absconditabacterales bacterium]|nr:hypothetical protein [Candidatus Absconditabacterales bacterium]